MLDESDGRHVPRYGLAIARLGVGDVGGCYDALEQAAIDGDPTFCSVAADPIFAACHDDPPFVALLSRHGLRPPGTPATR